MREGALGVGRMLHRGGGECPARLRAPGGGGRRAVGGCRGGGGHRGERRTPRLRLSCLTSSGVREGDAPGVGKGTTCLAGGGGGSRAGVGRAPRASPGVGGHRAGVGKGTALGWGLLG